MKLALQFLNCLWLLIPLLVWNIVLGPRITQDAITSDANSPSWLLGLENITRIVVFGLPLFIPLQLDDKLSQTGLWVFILGTLVYFATWLPLILSPDSSWSTSAAGLLAPRLSPFLPFLGIAAIGHNWPYAAVSALFIFFHTWHGVQNL